MRKFIINTLIFGVIITLIHLFLALLANGTTDDYYQKFASSKRSSLVLGTSRALQGVIPTLVDSFIEDNKNCNLYNFAFTVSSSSYGKVYLNAIKNKVDTTKNGYFVVTIDPWAISENKSLKNKEYDTKSVLYEMNEFSSRPNYEYLFKKYPNGWGMIALKRLEIYLLKKKSKQLNNSIQGSFSEIDNNGWLNVFTSMDMEFVYQKEKEKFKNYTKNALNQEFSFYRYSYLVKTIKYLKKYGDVYLIRLPVHHKIYDIETNYMFDFETKISSAINLSKGYLDMNKNASHIYKFTDGNHLFKESAKDVSIKIGKWIKQLQQRTNYRRDYPNVSLTIIK